MNRLREDIAGGKVDWVSSIDWTAYPAPFEAFWSYSTSLVRKALA